MPPPFSIIPIDRAFVRRARHDGIDDLGQPVERLLAAGGEPCRDALRRALPGERLILASYSPFKLAGPYREYGPVFILAEDDAAAPDLSVLPTGGYLAKPFILRAYCGRERIVDAVLAAPDEAGQALERLFERGDVAFVLARFMLYGCYAARIENERAAPCPWMARARKLAPGRA